MYCATKHGISGFVRSLAPLSTDPNINVRVTAVAPGVIKTPLWTDNPDKMRYIADGDEWVTAEFVADAMTSLIEQDEIEVAATTPGGTLGGASGDAREGTRKVQVVGGMVLEVAKGLVESFLLDFHSFPCVIFCFNLVESRAFSIGNSQEKLLYVTYRGFPILPLSA